MHNDYRDSLWSAAVQTRQTGINALWHNRLLKNLINYQEHKKEKNKMERRQYVCPKCGNMHYESDQFQATGGNFAKVFDIQNKKFATVSCPRCGFTELYKRMNSDGWDIIDFLIG